MSMKSIRKLIYPKNVLNKSNIQVPRDLMNFISLVKSQRVSVIQQTGRNTFPTDSVRWSNSIKIKMQKTIETTTLTFNDAPIATINVIYGGDAKQ